MIGGSRISIKEIHVEYKMFDSIWDFYNIIGNFRYSNSEIAINDRVTCRLITVVDVLYDSRSTL